MGVKGNVSRCTSSVSRSRQGRSSLSDPCSLYPDPEPAPRRAPRTYPRRPGSGRRLSRAPCRSPPRASGSESLRLSAPGTRAGVPRGPLGGPIRVGAARPAEAAVSAGSCSSPALRDALPGTRGQRHVAVTRVRLGCHCRGAHMSACKTRLCPCAERVPVSKRKTCAVCKTRVCIVYVQSVSSC